MKRTALIALAAARAIGAEPALAPADLEFFEKRIRPVLSEHCYECHGPEKQKGGLRLDSRDAVLKGGDSGPALVAGKPDDSLIIKAARYTDKDLAMPPSKDGSKKLPVAVIADLESWVKRGAPDPRKGETVTVAKGTFDFEAERKKWAFKKPERPPIPAVKQTAWVQTPVDFFVLAKIEAAGLAPAPPASARALVRRMTFDLTGLPPTPEEVDAFEKAAAIDRKAAISALVERLLASPAYGERWARHWLDVARYADSLDARGTGQDGDILDAWRYRDWVVDSFNRDLPYDQFVTHQIAGDILAEREWDAGKMTATSLFAIGNWGNGDSDKKKVYTDIVDDQIDVVGRAFLGLTLACARCHDHKFDPITTADYYGLAGFFFSSHILDKFAPPTNGEKLMRIALESPEERVKREAIQQRLAAVEGELKGGLQPTTEFVPQVLGKAGLVGLKPKTADNPSMVINRADADVAFLTIKLPPRAIAMHPGPKSAATLAWRAPAAGAYKITARMQDADPNCGDGVEWIVRAGGKALGSGKIDNGRGAQFAETAANVDAGELVQLVVKPRAEYTCDSTQVELIIRAEDGRAWDARDYFTKSEGTVSQPADGVWWFCEGEGVKLSQEDRALDSLKKERDELRGKLTPPPMTQGLREGGIPESPYAGFHDARIHVRGSYDRLGETQPRAFPTLFAAPKPEIQGSGRLELAKWIADSANPMTARVMANRIWQHHFGEGIVRTPNNFGKLGEPPTHPELLDWLAQEFVARDWSIKEIHRLILLSSTYQQASVSPASSAQDPENRLFGRQQRRRLSAEELRDAMLAVSGALDRKLGGPSARELNATRRTLYITTIRSDRATYQLLFDGADPNAIVEKRTESVVAPQALWLMNHPFTLEQTARLSARAKQIPDAERVPWLFQNLYGRAPHADEAELLRDSAASDESLEKLCQVLLCANEFIYVD